MPSSRSSVFAALAVGLLGAVVPSRASAQQQAEGFGVERLYQSAPGAGWLVMDDLGMHGPLAGGIAASSGYAHHPLVLNDGSQRLAVISDQAFFDIGVAVTLHQLRFSANVASPLSIVGQSGVIGGYRFNAPSAGLGPTPDTFSDVRFGVEMRLYGDDDSALRLGLGAQLFVDSGERADYVTDNTYRAMGRVLFAGDVGAFTYAGHLGVHVRPLDDDPVPGSPRGSELLYGVAGGLRHRLVEDRSDGGTRAVGHLDLVVGPELFGESAFTHLFAKDASNLEGLLGGRLEGGEKVGMQWRAKLGLGAGLAQHFGAPTWRMVFAIELFGHASSDDR